MCKSHINAMLQEYTCPRCDSGFIEELPDQQPRMMGVGKRECNATACNTCYVWHSIIHNILCSLDPTQLDKISLRGDPERDRERERDRDRDRESQARDRRYRLPRTRHSFRRHRVERSPAIEGIIQQMLGGLWGPARSPFPPFTLDVLHSSPADYVWGAGGLDAIITQLLGQLDNTGPPPADKEKISSLPRITIAQEHLNCSMECAVCKEDYSVGESVRQLPCLHLFHSNCIVPWLEMHDSCPVCRKGLNSELDSTDSSQMELM
uniref:Ring finger protein 115 n=1 Tax=Petromyzon marinus TaxID=7757 RepID=S4R5Q2_PETMA